MAEAKKKPAAKSGKAKKAAIKTTRATKSAKKQQATKPEAEQL
ncbi:hypothetical protein [Nonomuraea sp. NPDC046570]